MARKYFGTDGIRGRVGSGAITPEFMLKLGWAAGRVLGGRFSGPNRIMIGKDTRISGYMFESALESGLIAAGVDVGLLGPMPTPAIAYLTRTFQAQAGIVISASHNDYTDNGIKFFSANGTKLPDEIEQAIEDTLDEPLVVSEHLGKAQRIEDASGRYVEYCKGTMPWGFSLRSLKIVLDCANGATYNIAPNVFGELGADIVVMAAEPDGSNINRNCGSTKPKALQTRVLQEKADLGIAFDGDGDRLIFVDHKGEVVDGDEILYIIAAYRQQYGSGCNGVAGTLMSNYGFELAMKKLDIPFARSNVGDRYVIQTMREKDWKLGGESSGHIICADVTTTGDGIIAALQVLLGLVTAGESLHDFKQGMCKLPQVMINVRMSERRDLSNNETVNKAVAEVEAQLLGRGRVLLRPSGTEPLIRVMVEGDDKTEVDRLCRRLAEVVELAVA